ncbi:hypothetical protein AN191_12385 [Loktanella sp. 5RATIMAR09]|uniref:hypothetical protein n=1 Tax=Loktanella sp. 5RATIMAR09 TaxID=1225655 RepID=UPI0006EB5CE9|nr:hypothetical protein [Loktanella sp. 5RATIMAR09]KQI71418.1 hypothetical protein AN191_12385 [Loktanella sp. 5RATIMAR09]
MKDPELDILIKELESQRDMSIAGYDGVLHALAYLLPQTTLPRAENLNKTDAAMLIADEAYPNWSIHIRGRTNARDGHWHCTLRENDSRDSDAAIGSARSPVLAQAVLAGVLRLAMAQKA